MNFLERRNVRGVVFDLWNTLAYNNHRLNPIIALARAFGVLGDPGWIKTIERGMMLEPLPSIHEAIRSLSRHTGVELSPRQAATVVRHWERACRRTQLFDDVFPVLSRLEKRFRLGLLSNTQSFDLEFLDRSGLAPRFQARVFSFQEARLKPDAVLFTRMAERLSLCPRKMVMVGDNLRDDVQASESVGMQGVLIRRGASTLSWEERKPDREPIASLWPLAKALTS